MWTERLLARIRQASAHEDADAERITASGFVTQVLGEHKRRGGADPRATTRRQLLAKSVPLRCCKVKKQAKPRGAFVNYMI
eukprot:2609295-Lingulodinium_polyedra.AAC.1